MSFRFVVCPALSSIPIGELELGDVSWNDPCYGVGGAFSGKAEINDVQDRDKLRILTEPDAVALYVYDDSTGEYPFGGPIFDSPWNPDERRLEIKAQSWKSWAYHKLFGMNRSTNPASDTLFSRLNKDQFVIAQDLFSASVNADQGCPFVSLGTQTSGVMRDLNVHGSDFKFVGDIVDSMANRDDGFEWNIDVVPNVKRNPTLRLGLYFPGRGSLNNRVMILHQQTEGGNILSMDRPQSTTSERRSRVWATGAGQPPDMPVAFDQDPAIPTGFTLLREAVRNYSSVTGIGTLASHARSERNYRNHTLQSVVVKVGIDDPDYSSYTSGDKIRLLVEDDWINWDFEAVRIVERSFLVNHSGDPDSVKLLIDLNDTELPQNQAVL